MSTRLGAWVRRARLQARFGRPIPTNTTSPSRSSRAATTAIISSGEYGVEGRGSEAVVHSGGDLCLRLESRRQAWMLFQVRRSIRDSVHKLIQVRLELVRLARDRFPAHVEVVVAIVVALRVRGM